MEAAVASAGPIAPIEARDCVDHGLPASARGRPDRPLDLQGRQFDRARHLEIGGRRTALQTDEPMARSQALLQG